MAQFAVHGTPRSVVALAALFTFVGLLVFALSLGPVFGVDLLGWAAAPKTWIELGKAVQPASPAYASLGGLLALLSTYLFVLALMLLGAGALGANIFRFAVTFSVVFWLAYLCWIAGNYAYIAVTTPAEPLSGSEWGGYPEDQPPPPIDQEPRRPCDG